jgi:protein-tyrosine-phosphatase
VPRLLEAVPTDTQVVTVCDRAHEELRPAPDWWHWSIPDPVESSDPRAFDAVVHELDLRIHALTGSTRTAT